MRPRERASEDMLAVLVLTHLFGPDFASDGADTLDMAAAAATAK
jgi:hypothetical protein